MVIKPLRVVEKPLTVDAVGFRASAHEVITENSGQKTTGRNTMLHVKASAILHMLGQRRIIDGLPVD